MELHELMVGNIVGRDLDKYPHNIFIVEEIGDTCKLYEFPHTDPRDQIHFFDVRDLCPVPLDETWLKRMDYVLDRQDEHVFNVACRKPSIVKRSDFTYKHKKFGYEKDDWRNVKVKVIKDPDNGIVRG